MRPTSWRPKGHRDPSSSSVSPERSPHWDGWAHDTAPLRPLVTLTRHTASLIKALVQAYDVVAAVLIEQRLDVAQRATAAVQQAIDSAADEAAKASAILGRAERVLGARDPVGALIAEAFQGDPIAAVARGQSLLEAQTGRSGGPQSGLAAIIYDAVISTTCDPDEFWRLVRAQLKLLDGVRPEIPGIVSDPLFTSRVADVTHDLWEAARRAAVAPNTETLRAEARELLEAGHLLVEQPLKFQLGVACAATTRMTFVDTQASDVSQLINIARDKRWEVKSGIGDSLLRNAFGHRDFEVVNDEVSLSPHRRRRDGQPEVLLKLDDVQDRVLRLVETVAAMDLALSMTMEYVGVSLAASPLGPLVVGPLLSGIGWSNVEIRDDGTQVTVSAAVSDRVPLAALAYAAQPFAGSRRQLVLRLARSDSGACSEIHVDLIAFGAWANAADEFEKEAAFLHMGHATQRNGQALFSDAHVEKFLAFRGCQALVDQSIPGRDVARQVKIWRRIARDAGMEEVDRQLGKGLRLRLQAEAGLGFDPTEFEDLLGSAGQTLPPLPDSLV